MNVRRLRLVRVLRGILDFMLILAGVFVAAFALWLLFSMVGAGGGGRVPDVSIPVAFGEGPLFHVLPVEIGPDAASVVDSLAAVGTRGELRFVTTHVRLHLLASATLILGSLVVLWGLFLLRQILATTAEGSPFHRANVRRLNLMGWILVGVGILGPVAEFLLSRWILTYVGATRPPMVPPAPLPSIEAIFGGLLLLVLASIWHLAADMAEEQSLTV